MKQITADQYCEGVESIYVEQPEYDSGDDGSNGKCDCIGMGRGALIREGIPEDEIKGMNGTNYALRHTFLNVQKIKSEKQLRKGDIVLKTRDKDDPDMRLPDQYRKGGSDYSEKWGETNCTHYGTVTREWPNLEITHMTSPTAKKDYKLGNWKLFGQLPWVKYDTEEPAEDEEQTGTWVRVQSENGKPVKMRAKPSTLCRTWWEVPNGSEVILMEPGNTWSGIIWAGRSGYMMTKFLQIGTDLPIYGVIINTGLTKAQAEELVRMYGGEITAG